MNFSSIPVERELCCSHGGKEFPVCPHLESRKAEALRGLHSIARYMAVLRENKAKGVPQASPGCQYHGCGSSERVHSSLHTPTIYCYRHLKEYWNQNHNAFLSVDLQTMEVYCHHCRDYVYLQNANDADQKWRLSNSNGNRYNNWTPSEAEIATLSQHSSSVFMKEHMLGLRGINNLGNTCFMSVIIQVFVNNPLLWKYFLEDSHSASNCSQTRVGQNCITCNMDMTFNEMFDSNKTPYSPLHLMYSIWKDQDSHMAGYHQQDAHEFFVVLLQGFHSGWKVRSNLRQSGPGPCHCLIHKIFGGVLRSDLICSSCHNVSTVTEPYLHVSLGVPEFPKKTLNYPRTEADTTLMACLHDYCNVEEIDAFCNSCKLPQPQKKQMSIDQLPPLLCLHLKRFKQERNEERKKVETCVYYPQLLNLSPYLSETIIKLRSGDNKPHPKVSYSLYAVVNHIGHSMDNGHYTCYIRHNLTSQWFKFDDHMVTKATLPEVLDNQSQAYMLFYMKDTSS